MKDENQLVEQFKKGNKQSFEILFRSYYAPLCLFATKYVSNNDDCEEIVQELFFKLWENRKTLQITSSVKGYLFSSIKNQCFNYLKHQKIKNKHQAETIREYENSLDSDFDFPETGLLQKISESIEALPPRRREIFKLSREQGLKYQEIADQLGLSVKTVETHLGLALKSLRETLKQYRQILISFFMCGIKGK